MKFAARRSLFLFAIFFTLNLVAQTAPRPLRASEVMALEAGGALQANIAHAIAARGLSFHPNDEFVSLMKKAGADKTVLETLKAAKVDASATAQPDQQLLQQLSDAAVLMHQQKYSEASEILDKALDASFARMETGYVMAELLRQQGKFDVALSVYGEILEKAPDFPAVHVKASYLLYKLENTDEALNEAKAALEENPDDAEAHKNKALALDNAQKFDAAIAEYKEALRIKPDYAPVHYDLGLLYYHMRSYDESIAEYKKAITLDPNMATAHYNLGVAYERKGDIAASIPEYREAKRLNPNDPAARQNLASALMEVAPGAAIVELRELEQKFPNFALCHICLGNALDSQGDIKGAEQEYRKANELDPTDPSGHRALGSIQEDQKNYDAALEEYRLAEKINPDDSKTLRDIGRILLAKKDITGALAELKQAESLSQTSWEAHDLYGQALEASGQRDLAAGEFKQAIALNPKGTWVMTELGSVLEKKGDWVGAFEQYRKAVLMDAAALMKAPPGQSVESCEPKCTEEATAAQGRFADYLVSLKSAGRGVEAAELQKRVAMLDTQAGTQQKVTMALQAGDKAFQDRNIDAAEKSYKEAVNLAQNLPPGDENLIVALGRLGIAYGMRKDYTDAEATFNQQMALVEKTFGPGSERSAEPLRSLGQLAIWQKNYKEAESYLLRALEINTGKFGDNSPPAEESLRTLAGLYMAQSDWPKAETYLLRAVKSAEVGDPAMLLIPLWGLCDVYDRASQPDKAQPCWHRATEVLEVQVGHDSPRLSDSLTKEANALRQLGRKDEAASLEERVTKIHRTAQN